jgi:Protein of unknown function (DUF3485)
MKRFILLNPATILTTVLLGGSAIGLHAAIESSGAHLSKLPINPPNGLRFHSLPVQTETWERLGADPPPLTVEVLESLGTRNYISRNYVKKGSMDANKPIVIDVHCAYYTGMVDTVPHIPERCFVGGGMRLIASAVTVPIPIDLTRFPPDPTIDPAVIDPNTYGTIRRGRTGQWSNAPGVRPRMPFGFDKLELRVTEYEGIDGSRVFSGYFFVANGWVASDTIQVRQQAFDLSADYAYYAKVQFTSSTVDSAKDLGIYAADFLNEMAPEIMRRIPDWTSVLSGEYPPADNQAESTTRPQRGTDEFKEWKKDFVPPDLPGRRK